MQQALLKAKLHNGRVTHSHREYEGSCAIDGALLDVVGICEYEQIQLYNKTNGERFTTYTIRAQEGSGIISVNGAAAHKAAPGDYIIICCYAILTQQELSSFKPVIAYLNEQNQIVRISEDIPVQMA